MSDIKLFCIGQTSVTELPTQSPQVEKSLQNLFEQNLETLLGVRFLASEYSTGPVHGGRIDTLGIDEDGSPVIIEYKRSVNENVINQGLFYLDWLMDHKKCQSASKRDPLSACNRDPLLGFVMDVTSAPLARVGA